MSRVSFNRKRVKLKQLLGIRARLALLALILVAPLMLERARSLEDARSRQIALASRGILQSRQHSADAQREVISSVETILKSAAYIRASAGGIGRSCDMLRASLPANLPWIRSLLIVGKDGRVQCSTNNRLSASISATEPISRRRGRPATSSSATFCSPSPAQQAGGDGGLSGIRHQPEADAVILAGVNLDWMSKIMSNLGGRPGISAVLVDSAGIVLAAPADQASMIGHPLDAVPLLSAIAEKASVRTRPRDRFRSPPPTARNARQLCAHCRHRSRLIVSIDEAKVSAAINREIRTAYLQLGFVCLFVLLGALIAAEKLIIQPIEMMAAMAKRFGQGDWSARAARSRCRPNSCRWPAPSTRWRRSSPSASANWSPPTTG